ncbi:Protein phosphatase methylesterase 1 [Xylographa opegraphella]|nr:Protein phosphatase methylesterase 1 [Xylographa opegraphella]
MSDLQRSFAKAKLAGLPFNPPLPPGTLLEEDEDERELIPEPSPDDDSSSASSASSASSTGSTGTIKPSPSKHLFARPKGIESGHHRNLDPLPWSDFFSQELYLEHFTPNAKLTHHVYLTPPGSKGPLFVTHHGAGSSGLSFAVCASEIRKALPEAGILSIDARGHGETTYQRLKHGTHEPMDAEELKADWVLDLSLEVLSEDMATVVRLTQAKMGWVEFPGLILVGHSLGGAVVVDVAKAGKLGNAVLGFAVLDVVEGSAIDALGSMETYLSSRPTTFPSISAGIEWHTRTRTIRNPFSARVSVPSLLCPTPTTFPSSARPPARPFSSTMTSTLSSSSSPLPADEPITTHFLLKPQPQTSRRTWTWRTDLTTTSPFWHSWFLALSSKFLSAKGGKLLLLAGTDRLDKELMIGQMQGKYQLQVFPDAGHFIQEDLPAKTAGVLVDFWRRNEGGVLVLPRKVGEGAVIGGSKKVGDVGENKIGH